MQIRLVILLAFILVTSRKGFAQQTGDIDTNFRISRNGVLAGTVYKVLVQPDQKVLAFGNFTGIGTWNSPHLLRFHPDGLVDTTFRSPFWVGQVKFKGNTLFLEGNGPQILDDGKLLVSGKFDSVGSDSIRGIVLLSPEGKIDTSFKAYKTPIAPNLPLSQQLCAIKSNSGKIYTLFMSGDNSVVARLLANGDWDTSFHFVPPSWSQDVSIIKISPLRNGRFFLHLYNSCNHCPPDAGPTFYGATLTDSGQVGYIPEAGWRWMQEDTLSNLYSFFHYHLCWTCNPTFLRYSQVQETVYTTSLGIENVDVGQLMDDQEVIATESNQVHKIIHINAIPEASPIGNTDSIVYAMARNSSNQAYLGGSFTQYNGQPFSKLIRIHNFKTILSVNSIQELAVRLYPNPSLTNQCILERNGANPEISVTDIMGKQIPFSLVEISANSVQLQLENSISEGICFVMLKDKHSIKTLKWMISH